MRRGFTIVEMLVATALVMLLMLLFANVFEVAIGTITAQRGIANNDQKARSFTTVVRHDLAARTYRASAQRGALREISPGILESPRGIVPLAPGDQVDPRQDGYLYVSENDVDDDTDDVFQFTAFVTAPSADAGPAPFYGRAQNLDAFSVDPNNPNQPERDDGIAGDGASSSRAAEIAYFVRSGNLYRRVMLLREPLPGDPPFGTQPTTGSNGTGGPFTNPAGAGPPYFNQPYTAGRSFYHDWDFSGTRILANDVDGDGPDPEGAPDEYQFHFHGLPSLDNSLGTANRPLGIPWNRFGFYSQTWPLPTGPVHRPVEYLFDSTPAPIAFIGRFTHEETSHIAFDWPGIEQGPGVNLLLRTDLVLSPDGVVAVDANGSGAYDAGDTRLQGRRAGEDILLTNVEAFDVKVWDPREDRNNNGLLDPHETDLNGNGVFDAGTWVDVGHSDNAGLYAAAAVANPAYGPGGPAGNRVYDTWHPTMGARPPYRPLQVTPSDPRTIHYQWNSTTPYSIGDIFFPDALGPDGAPGIAGVDDDGNGIQDFDTVTGAPDVNEFEAPGSDDNLSIGFVVIEAGTSAATEPTWPRTPGTIVEDGTLGTAVRWQCFDNRIGLERIRITVRYRDVGTGQARQVTLIHSLVD